MRTFLTFLWGFIGSIALLGICIYLGGESRSWLVFFGAAAVAVWLFIIVGRAINLVGREPVANWMAKFEQCPYRSAWDGSGIALDTSSRKLHLLRYEDGKPIEKSYDFDDIREWGYEAPGVTRVIGGGMEAAGANAGSIMRSIEGTGLWIRVRDTTHPKWFVKFKARSAHDKATLNELERWIEILNQEINEFRTAKPGMSEA